jgi:hypothetical protein
MENKNFDNWENIRLPEDLLDYSYEFSDCGNKFSDIVEKNNIQIDLTKPVTIEIINKIKTDKEFDMLIHFIDNNEIYEERLLKNPSDSRNRYSSIFSCK